MTLFEMLKPEPDPIDSRSSLVYDLAHVVRIADGIDSLGDVGQILATRKEDGWVSFCVFDFAHGPATCDGEEVDGVKLELVLHGGGPGGRRGGSLRELRHTYWGQSGYIFDPNSKLIAAAFAALGEWFDVAGGSP